MNSCHRSSTTCDGIETYFLPLFRWQRKNFLSARATRGWCLGSIAGRFSCSFLNNPCGRVNSLMYLSRLAFCSCSPPNAAKPPTTRPPATATAINALIHPPWNGLAHLNRLAGFVGLHGGVGEHYDLATVARTG